MTIPEGALTPPRGLRRPARVLGEVVDAWTRVDSSSRSRVALSMDGVGR